MASSGVCGGLTLPRVQVARGSSKSETLPLALKAAVQ